MKKVIRLTEADLARIVKRVISEQVPPGGTQNRTTVSPIENPRPRYNLPDGRQSPSYLPEITSQEKLNAFLDWGAKDPSEGANVLATLGYPSLKNYASAALTPEGMDKLGECETYKRKDYIVRYYKALNLALTTVAIIGMKGNYMDQVHSQIASKLPPPPLASEAKNCPSLQYVDFMKDNDLRPIFDKTFQTLLNKQLTKIKQG